MRLAMICCCASALLASSAQAADWVQFFSNDKGNWYADSETIERSGSNVIVWLKETLSHSDTDGEASSVDRWAVDCTSKRAMLLSYVSYDSDGAVLSTSDIKQYDREWKSIAPETMGEALMHTVCPK